MLKITPQISYLGTKVADSLPKRTTAPSPAPSMFQHCHFFGSDQPIDIVFSSFPVFPPIWRTSCAELPLLLQREVISGMVTAWCCVNTQQMNHCPVGHGGLEVSLGWALLHRAMMWPWGHSFHFVLLQSCKRQLPPPQEY